jgi:cytochrome c
MGELGLNKVFGALLAIILAIMALREVSAIVFGDGGHHGHHDYASVNEWADENFAYRVAMTEVTSSGEAEEEDSYDLGLLLAGADLSAGERSFKGKCSTCHSIDQAGANGTGPNLYGLVGAPKGQVAAFSYSGALDDTAGGWSYDNLDAWLLAPSKYARGTSMAFAGIRRDDERANVIAYLASYSPDAPALPEAGTAADEAGAEAEALAGDIAIVEAESPAISVEEAAD